MMRLFSRGVTVRVRWFLTLFLICSMQGFSAEKNFHFTFQPDQVEQTRAGLFHQVRLKDGDAPLWTPGHPDLPCKYVNILLPPGAIPFDVKATVKEMVLAEDILVYPFQSPRPLSDKSPVVFASPVLEAYNATEKIPQQGAGKGDRHTMRGYTYLTVRLNPVRYLPAEKRLYLATNLNLTVSYDVPYESKSVSFSQKDSAKGRAVFADIVAELVVNPEDIASMPKAVRPKGDTPLGDIDYLIVTSQSLSNSFQRLADYRAEQDGFSTKVLTTSYIDANYSGVDIQEKVKNCVADYYIHNALTYFVIGGDNTIVADRDCYVTCSSMVEEAMPTDLYYSGLDSTWDEDGDGVYGEADYSGSSDEGDLAFDVIVGRIPVRTAADFDNYFDKLTQFETNSPPDSFYQKMIFLGVRLGGTYSGSARPIDIMDDGFSEFQEHEPLSDAEIWQRRKYKEEIRPHWVAGTEHAIFFDSLTSWDSETAGDYALTAANVSTRLNEGWYFLNMFTHGNTKIWEMESGNSFSSSSASSLTGMTAIVCTEACITGSFDKSDDPCLSEAFLRNGQGGAIAYMGCSRSGWGAPGSHDGGPSTHFVDAFYEQVLENDVLDIGQAFAASKASLIGNSGYNGAYRWIQFGLNFQGDPAFRIRITKTPPVAKNASVVLFKNASTNLVLKATDEGDPTSPGILTYTITSLPSNGTLSDPGAGAISSVPYTLAGNGKTVTYSSNVIGADHFTFIANDGGTLPDGGDSNIATVELSVIAGILSLSASEYSVEETNGTLQVNVVRTGCDEGLVRVDFSTTDGTAEAGLDYVATNGTLNFPDGVSSGTITIEIIDDLRTEEQETLTLVLSNPAGGAVLTSPDSATISILFDDGLIAGVYMDSDPGWNEEGLWGFGQPTGGGGSYGSPDPTAGFTGNNVLGYNLSGDYENGLTVKYLTSTAFDCSLYTNVTLEFKRWLCVESSNYDHANLQVSTNGTTWVDVWENSTDTLLNGGWVSCLYDISSVADQQSAVYLRWGMGVTDGGEAYCGWNIDDVELLGERIFDIEEEDETNLPYSESFEECTLGGLNGQNAWIADAGAVVTNSTAESGIQSLRLSEATASRTIAGSPTNIWLTLWAKPVPGDAPATIDPEAAAVFYVNANNLLVAYSNTTPIEIAGATILSNDWNKIKIFCDYSSKVWNLELNGIPRVGNFAFYGTPAHFQTLEISEASANACFVDSIYLTAQIDTDSDSIPDDWEQEYFGGATNAVATNLCANGINTVLEAYIAGLNPTNSESSFMISELNPLNSGSVIQWNTINGRVYTISWASNLLSGFQCLETNSTGTFTDTVHKTDQKGFYKIEVELAP